MKMDLAQHMNCTNCGAPLRHCGSACQEQHHQDSEHLYPCARVSQQPGVLIRLSVQEALTKEPSLDAFLLATTSFPEASIFAASGEDFPAIVPAAFHDSRLCVARLPAMFEPRLVELATERLDAFTELSADLMSASTHLVWEMPDFSIHFSIDGFEPLFSGSDDRLNMLFLFISGGTVLLCLHPVDDTLLFSLQASGMGSGENYRPYRVWSDEELAEAAEKAQFEESEFVRTLDDGTIALELQGYAPRTGVELN